MKDSTLSSHPRRVERPRQAAPSRGVLANPRVFLRMILLLVPILFGLSGCSADWIILPGQPSAGSSSGEAAPSPTAAPLPPMQSTEVQFRVELPANTPQGAAVYLSILDEVTGLALNPRNIPMQAAGDGSEAPRSYQTNLTFPIGSVVKYRYLRQAGDSTVAEHISDGRPVRYRMYVVQGPGQVEDVVSSWTDTPYIAESGRIMGKITDSGTQLPIPNLLVTAGGVQTLTTSDGSFLIEGLPAGVHNLVAYALNGAYNTFQQGARVSPNSTTPAAIQVKAAELVKVVFVVTPPGDTPPVIPIRLAGSLYQTGNTFADLSGGTSAIAINMPVLQALPDGRYTTSLFLPVGADIRYKYTLGDGFWNAELRSNGAFRERQMIVPEKLSIVDDVIETWQTPGKGSITFDVTAPPDTPEGEQIFIQFNPLFGWTEPIPMWQLADNRWAYRLYSPLNLPGSISYRYCRNGQCVSTPEAQPTDEPSTGHPLEIGESPQTIKDIIAGWGGLGAAASLSAEPQAGVIPREAGFMAGVEFQPSYHPSWRAFTPQALAEVQALNSRWLVAAPTWTFTRLSPPVLELVPGQDAMWPDLVGLIEQSKAGELSVAINPTPRFPQSVDTWWEDAPRDYSWWVVWFEHYRSFILHHADLADQTGAEALIIGGDWIAPALPGGLLADGSHSDVPADAEMRWRSLLTDVRAHYAGTLMWALPYQSASSPPAFIDAVDQIYLLWEDPVLETGEGLAPDAGQVIDNGVLTLSFLHDKPVVLAATLPSSAGLQEQADAYEALLEVVNSRDWIAGFIARGFYPPMDFQDKSASVHGKPASETLKYWFAGMDANPAP